MPSVAPAPTPVGLHVVALRLIEGGDIANARRILDDLCASSPDYVPGLVERALLLARQGELGIATSVMRDVVARTDRIDTEQILPGPEPLPVGFYRGAAQSFLGGRGRS
jgi:hypothetical protein